MQIGCMVLDLLILIRNFAKNIMQNLSKCLSEVRSQKGFTLRQVEEATGVSNAYLSQLENGKIKKPSANVLYKLSSFYGLVIEEVFYHAGLINEKPDPSKITSIGAFAITQEEEQQLLDFLSFLRHKKR